MMMAFLFAAMFAASTAEFATPQPPTGGNDLTVQIVPGWAERTAREEMLRGNVTPMAGNAPARWRCAGAVELPVGFADNPIARASWDINCTVDLSNHAGIEFDFWCGDISQFSQLRFYLRSGDGWYATWPFAPEKEREWCRIRIAKDDFNREGKCLGFDRIDGLRISGWRNGGKDTVIGFANLSYTDAVIKKLTRSEIAERDRRTLEWVRTLPSKPGEYRAFWCHSPFGPGGARNMAWDEAIRRLKDCGFNAIYVNLAWAGCAYYKSAVLPPSPQLTDKGDQLEECLAACRRHGVEMHAWKMCWVTGGTNRTDGAVAADAKRRGLLQMNDRGDELPHALCPSDPEVRRREAEAFVELAKKGVDGIHFDRVRHNATSTCFCRGCRKRFESKIGHKVDSWPVDVLPGGSFAKEWTDFRADSVTALVREVAERVRREAPGVKISAAVFNSPYTDREGMGQDWPLWCREGWLDIVCPMDYTVSPLLLKSMVDAQKAAGGKARVIPGLGLSLWPKGTDRVRNAAEQIEVVREAGLDGFIFFNYAVWHFPQLEALRQGPLKD